MKKIILIVTFFVLLGIALGLHAKNSVFTNAKTRISTTPSIAPLPGLPVSISIPAIGVNAAVESVGLDSEGRMGVPQRTTDTAWYNLGARPGEIGSAVIDGHLDTQLGTPAVFWNLAKLTPHDSIRITDNTGKIYSFIVSKVTSYPYNKVPLQKVFAQGGAIRLNLITCSGTWNHNQRNYSQRTVVYAILNK